MAQHSASSLRESQFAPVAALFAAAAVWGSTFTVVKDALEDVPPLEFIGLRFTISAIAIALVLPRAGLDTFRIERTSGVLIGIFLAAGAALQTVGLERTSASNAGFITGLYVVFTPLVDAAWVKRFPPRWALVGVVLSTVGLALLSLQFVNGGIDVNLGDVFVLMCAASFAVQIVMITRLRTAPSPWVVTIQQLGVTGIACGVLSLLTEDVRAPSARAWFAILFTGIFGSSIAVGIQVWAQQRISPTRAAVIASMEAPFAALTAFIVADERLSARAWAGAALIFIGLLVAEDSGRNLPPPSRDSV